MNGFLLKKSIFLASGTFFLSCNPDAVRNEPPNFLFIMSDDHGQQAISAYGSSLIQTPNIDRIAKEGMLFRNSFVTNSICGPSRAVLLTGKHSHLNGFLGNDRVFDGAQQTFLKILQQHGYQTAMIGKWHLGSDPAGFDYWNILPDQGDYYNPGFIRQGKDTIYKGYVTEIITDLTIEWLNKRDNKKPFCLMMQHKAPHRNWMPAQKNLEIFNDKEFPLPLNFYDTYSGREALKLQKLSVKDHMDIRYDYKVPCNGCDTVDVNFWAPGEYLRGLDRMTEEERKTWETTYKKEETEYLKVKDDTAAFNQWKYRRYMEDYLRSIVSVDESVGEILKYLEQNGLDKNTVVIYTSDQGFFLGEHGLFDKRYMYEEAMRTPLMIKFPGEIQGNSSTDCLVQNLDLAPTFLDIAGIGIPGDMQGRSLRSIWKGRAGDWRDVLYYHYYDSGWGTTPHYGIRTERYKLIHYYGNLDTWELFDLKRDPSEMNNVYHDLEYKEVVTGMKQKLESTMKSYGDSDELAMLFWKERMNVKVRY